MSADNPLIDRFVAYVIDYRQLAHNTARSYRADLAAFSAFLADRGKPVEKAQLIDIRRFVSTRTAEGHSPATINRLIGSLRTFFRYLQRTGVISENFARQVRYQRESEPLPAPLSQDELDRFFAVSGAGFFAARDRLLFETCYSTGALVSELMTINLDRIESDGTITVCNPVGEERSVFLGASARIALARYLPLRAQFLGRIPMKNGKPDFGWRERRPNLPVDAGRALFIDGRKHRLDVRGANLIVRARARIATPERAVSPQWFRNTFARDILNAGADIAEVQALLGQVKATTTLRYLRVAVERLRRTYTAAHPHAHETPELEKMVYGDNSALA